jgi:4-amino-4-deoxy-L-arabinose transferase-like glycosyltransferase
VNGGVSTTVENGRTLTRPVTALFSARLLDRGALVAVCLLGLAFASSGITNEGAVSLDGDMPRYLMNGTFFHDLVRDAPLRAPLEYARHYYARYPALTLGHHPFVPALAQVPAFLLFGISVFSARLTVLCAFVLTLAFWFRLIRDIYDVRTATAASLLFMSTPGMIPLFQVVLSEPFTLCLIVLSVYFMHRYCATQRTRYGVAFCISVVLSAYAKHLAVFLCPVYLILYVSTFGVRRLFRRSTLLAVAASVIAVSPLVPLTLNYSHWNIMLVTQIVKPGFRTSSEGFLRFARGLWTGSFRLSLPVLVLAAMSVIVAVRRRDRRALLFTVWIVSVYAGLLVVGVRNDRFFVYWIPAFCALAAAIVGIGSRTIWRAIGTIAVIAVVGYQIWLDVPFMNAQPRSGFRPVGAGGYEEAAQYVVANRLGDTVLYSAAIDTGYFVFFVRKHDPNREMIVLRADKILTTSRGGRLDFERRVNRPEEIQPILQRYGVGYVVIEDRAYPDGPLRWLQQIVQTTAFELRNRIQLESGDRRLEGATLSVYAYRAARPADRNATLSMNIPMMDDSIQVPLRDLIVTKQ